LSDQNDDGLLVSNEDGMYFIPAAALAEFKMTEAATTSVRDAIGADDEVSGFSHRPAGGMKPIDFGFSGRMGPVILQGVQYSDAATG
jgi:hypothetical protein